MVIKQDAILESLNMGSGVVAPEHILLGMIRRGEGVAIEVLRELGVDPSRLREKLEQLAEGEEGTSRS